MPIHESSELLGLPSTLESNESSVVEIWSEHHDVAKMSFG